ncbi:MAG: hypothetical protein QOH03_299, partial [Kribbellaceae bacterium]|nr:hypothetical protein [Kribbellaceae bacterium]
EHDWAEFAERRFEHLPVGVRTEMLAELTVARPEVKFVILTMPDRLGGDPHEWYAVGRDLASRGYGVVITCADASARLLGVEAAQLGSVTQPDALQVAAAAPVEPVAAAEVATQPVVPVGAEVPEAEETAVAEEIEEPEAEPEDDEEPVVAAEVADEKTKDEA